MNTNENTKKETKTTKVVKGDAENVGGEVYPGSKVPKKVFKDSENICHEERLKG